MAETGFLGPHSSEIYHLEEDDLYLVGTKEVPLAGFHADEILDLNDGPNRYAGWSSCYRREAGSYGKDTRGIIRVHQFDKVEPSTPSRRTPRRSTPGCSAGKSRCSRRSRCPTG